MISLIGIAFNLLKPWPVKIIVDEFLARDEAVGPVGSFLSGISPESGVLLLCTALVVVHLLAGLSSSISNFVFIRTGLQVLLDLRTRLYAALQAFSLKFHELRATADLSFRVAYDSQSIQTLYSKGFTAILASVVTLVSMVAIMLILDWQLTLLSIAIVPFVVWAIRYYAEHVRREFKAIQERESAVLTVAHEGLSSIRVVHAFGQEEREVSQLP